jgi:hypothetical protein
MLGIKSVISDANNWPTVACGVISLVGYCICKQDRWRRFLVLLLIVVMLVMAWWLFTRGGVVSLVHAYREISGQPGTGAHGAPTARIPAP